MTDGVVLRGCLWVSGNVGGGWWSRTIVCLRFVFVSVLQLKKFIVIQSGNRSTVQVFLSISELQVCYMWYSKFYDFISFFEVDGWVGRCLGPLRVWRGTGSSFL